MMRPQYPAAEKDMRDLRLPAAAHDVVGYGLPCGGGRIERVSSEQRAATVDFGCERLDGYLHAAHGEAAEYRPLDLLGLSDRCGERLCQRAEHQSSMGGSSLSPNTHSSAASTPCSYVMPGHFRYAALGFAEVLRTSQFVLDVVA